MMVKLVNPAVPPRRATPARSKGKEETMARRKQYRMRSNPFDAQMAKKVAMASFGVGSIAALTKLGMDFAFDRIQALHGVTGYSRAATYAGVGVVASGILQSFGLDIGAAGLGVGGVSSGILMAVDQYKANAASAALSAPQAAPQLTAPSQVPAPSQGAFLRVAR